MTFITDEDHRLNKDARVPSPPFVNPTNFTSTDEYWKSVANSMAAYARLAYRHGRSASCEQWVTPHGMSDIEIKQKLEELVKAYVGEGTSIALRVHTPSMSQEQTTVYLALTVPQQIKLK